MLLHVGPFDVDIGRIAVYTKPDLRPHLRHLDLFFLHFNVPRLEFTRSLFSFGYARCKATPSARLANHLILSASIPFRL